MMIPMALFGSEACRGPGRRVPAEARPQADTMASEAQDSMARHAGWRDSFACRVSLADGRRWRTRCHGRRRARGIVAMALAVSPA